MDVLAWIVGILVMGMFAMAGGMKLMDTEMAQQARQHLGVAKNQYMAIGGAEIAGVIGVLIGLISKDLEWIGVLACIGFVVLIIGAVTYHRRAGDGPREMAPAIVSGILAAVMIVLFFARPE